MVQVTSCFNEKASIPIQNNIVDLINELESGCFVEANKRKYSTAHYKEIQSALKRLDEKIRVVSFNILFSGNDQFHFILNENKWENRKVRVLTAIDAMDPDILGVQEPYLHQVEDLKNALPNYGYFGGADASGMNHGIFYKNDRFECVNTNIYPLEIQDEEYQHVINDPKWQTKQKVLIHTTLMDKKNLKILHVFNAHLSFFETDWREMDAKAMNQIAQRVLAQEKQKFRGCHQAAVLMGDWNTFENRPEMKLPAFDGNRTLNIIKGGQFVDAREEALLGYVGPVSTFTNDPEIDKKVGRCTPFNGNGDPGIFLDHILVSKDKITSIIHGVNNIVIGDQRQFPSDHMPILADILIN